MANSQRKRKTWEEKLNDAKDLPKVVQLKGKVKQRWHVNTLAIASPREIFSFIQKVPAGSVATIADLQSAVARKHGAELGCPLTTGIFTWIAANASEELEAKCPGSGAPYWRILKSDGSLNPKFPGGIKRQAEHLAQEGVLCEKRGAKTRVSGLANVHFHF
ncbi:MAG TPA: MGMT family protein [Candidatus Angelobacter sp.]|nr:MGMT family protein [Candidatus Angelobacter sp.]